MAALARGASRRVLPVVLFAALAGCLAGGRTPDAVSDDTVQIYPGGADEDYLVLFLNRQTLMINGDLAADRYRVASSRLKQIGCREPRMVREKAENREGSWSFGRPRVVYYSQWQCG